MHSTVFVAIPAESINGDYSIDNISRAVDSIVEPYCIETAPEGQAKMDGYEIGGRWAGFIGAKPEAKSIIPSSSGRFAYNIADTYDLLMNDGKPGNYKLGSLEIVPVDGGTKEDIIWDSVGRLQEYVYFMTLKLLFEREPRMGEKLPDPYLLKNDGLYINTEGASILLYKNGESFEENLDRTQTSINQAFALPDAYIDKEGNWHTSNDLWMVPKYRDELLNSEDPDLNPDMLFLRMLREYIDSNLNPDDYFLVLDCHY